MHTPSKSAPILVEYVKDWLAPTGGINVQFQDRSQVAAAITNSKVVLEEARRRGMEVIHASLTFEPKFKVLGARARPSRIAYAELAPTRSSRGRPEPHCPAGTATAE